MWFEINVRGINIKLQINGYGKTNRDNWDSEWCRCDFSFSSGNWLNYHKENYVVLLCCEVDNLEKALTEQLENKISGVKEIKCIEPDFVFKLYPKVDLRDDPKYTYIQPGFEIQDILLEWRIYFWDDGLTDNFLTITLDRDEIIKLKEYLVWVKNL